MLIETMEALMPSSTIDFSAIVIIIAICAVIDILSPGVLAVTGYLLLTHSNQFNSRLLVFLFTSQLSYFVLGLLLYFGGITLLKGMEKLAEFDLMNWFYLVAGTVLVLFSFSKPKEKTKQRVLSRIPRQTTVKGMVILGVIVFLIEFVTALPYFYSVFLMNHLEMKPLPSVLMIIGYNLMMVLPSLLLLGINIVFKAKLQQFLHNIRKKLNSAPFSSILTAMGVVGAVFFNIGLRGILN